MKNKIMKNRRSGLAVAALAICGLAVPANAAIVDGLVDYWELDGDYNAGVDASHVGTLVTTGTGSGTFVAGKFGSGIDLANSAGNQAVITIGGDENDMDFDGGNMSFSAWYTTESLYTGWQTLAGKGEGNGWRIARAGGSGNGMTFSGRKPHNFAAQTDDQSGAWHHVVTTVEGGVRTDMYVDGVLVGSDTSGYAIQGRNNAMQIGGNPDAANRGWNGNIDDVAVWNRVLTADEVSSIYNGGDGASIGSLISVIPEPSSTALLGLGGLFLAFRKRR